MDFNNNHNLQPPNSEFVTFLDKNVSETAKFRILREITSIMRKLYNERTIRIQTMIDDGVTIYGLKANIKFLEKQTSDIIKYQDDEITKLKEINQSLESKLKDLEHYCFLKEDDFNSIKREFEYLKFNSETKINEQSLEIEELRSKLKDLDSNYSKYYSMENEYKSLLDTVIDIDTFSAADLNNIDERMKMIVDDQTNLMDKYKSSIQIVYVQQKILNNTINESKKEIDGLRNEIKNLNSTINEYRLNFDTIQKENRKILTENENINYYYQMAVEQNEKLQEAVVCFNYALTDDYKRSLKEFYKELSNCIETLAKLVKYSQDVFNKKTKSMTDVSNLTMPILFDEKTWDPNLIFKKDFWPTETKKLRDLKKYYIELKIKCNILSLTDIE